MTAVILTAIAAACLAALLHAADVECRKEVRADHWNHHGAA